MKNVAVVVEDEPTPDVLAELGDRTPRLLFGLYHGTP
jgi:predicted Zn-dependent protease with MMP-like domain